jgi:hypothetical protein
MMSMLFGAILAATGRTAFRKLGLALGIGENGRFWRDLDRGISRSVSCDRCV